MYNLIALLNMAMTRPLSGKEDGAQLHTLVDKVRSISEKLRDSVHHLDKTTVSIEVFVVINYSKL